MADFTLSEEKFMTIQVPTAKGLIKTKLMDVEPCIKMYWPLYDLIDDLNSVETKMLGYLMHRLLKGSYTVQIDAKEVLDYLNRMKNGAPPVKPIRSQSYVYRGVAMLVDRGIISKKAGRVYAINPNMLFKGNRAVLLESSRKS